MVTTMAPPTLIGTVEHTAATPSLARFRRSESEAAPSNFAANVGVIEPKPLVKSSEKQVAAVSKPPSP